MLEGYIIHILIIIGIYLILSVSLNLSIGFTGLLNLGHIAFFGIGAYTSALLTKADFPFIISFILAGILASLFGALLVVATGRLKGDYLALATLGFAFVIYSILLNWVELTRGPLGIPGIPKPDIFGLMINTKVLYLIFVAVIAGISIVFLHRLSSSKFGKLLEGLRDDSIRLSVFGKNGYKLKIQSMMISAFFAGIAGSLYAHYITFIDPSTFHLAELIIVFTIVMVGGLASNRGVIIATFLMLIIPEVLRFVNMPSSIIGPMRQIIYALILILILMYRPRGIFGKIDLE